MAQNLLSSARVVFECIQRHMSRDATQTVGLNLVTACCFSSDESYNNHLRRCKLSARAVLKEAALLIQLSSSSDCDCIGLLS